MSTSVILPLDSSFKSNLLIRKFAFQLASFRKYCQKRDQICREKRFSSSALIPFEFRRDCQVLCQFPDLLNTLLLNHDVDSEFIFFFLRRKNYQDFNYLFSNLNARWRSDLVFIKRAIQENYQIFNYLRSIIQDDSNFINVELKIAKLVELNPEIIRYLVNLDGFNEELLLNACKKNISLLRFIPYYRDFHMSVIEYCPQALKYANDLLLDDEEVVLKAISQDKTCLQYASYSIIERVLVGNELLEYSVEDIKNLVSSAVKTKPWMFKYLPDSVKEDQGFVLKLLPYIRAFLPNSLKEKREFRMEWVKIDSKAFETCTDLELKSDRQFLLNSLPVHKHALRDSPPNLKDDKEFVLECLKFSWNILSEASERLRDDEDVVSFALMKYSYNFEHASNRLKDDKEFILKYIETYPQIFKYLNSLKKDKEIIFKVGRVGGLDRLDSDFHSDEEFVLDIAEKCPRILSSFHMYTPENIIRQTIQRNGHSLFYWELLRLNSLGEELEEIAALSSGYLSEKIKERSVVKKLLLKRMDLE